MLDFPLPCFVMLFMFDCRRVQQLNHATQSLAMILPEVFFDQPGGLLTFISMSQVARRCEMTSGLTKKSQNMSQ